MKHRVIPIGLRTKFNMYCIVQDGLVILLDKVR